MSTFTQMAAVLSVTNWPAIPKTDPGTPGISKTERMRQYLREHGWANSSTLAMEADAPQTALVGALLKGDLSKGRVIRDGNGYRWNRAFDDRTADRIKRAVALLRRHGYEVKKMKGSTS